MTDAEAELALLKKLMNTLPIAIGVGLTEFVKEAKRKVKDERARALRFPCPSEMDKVPEEKDETDQHATPQGANGTCEQC